MTTISDVLKDLGIGEDVIEKTANDNNDINQLDKLAMDLGVVEKNNENTITNNEPVLNKEASVKDLGQVFAELFPTEDISLVEKVANASVEQEAEKVAMEKEAAAIEEAKGAHAHDVFAGLFDARLEKIAAEIVGKIEDNEDESGKTPGVKEDTSEAEKILGVNPEGAVGEFKKEKTASESEAVKVAEELFNFGAQLAAETVEAMDKVAEEKEKEEKEEEKKELNEEQKKEASFAGAIMERAFFENLVKEGSEKHQDPMYYIADAIIEKIASAAEVETEEEYMKVAGKVSEFMKRMGNKAKGQAKSVVHHGKQAVTGMSERHGHKLSNKERLASGAKALAKGGVAAAAVGAGAVGAKKALSDKE